MIRKLVLAVAAVFGLSAVALGQQPVPVGGNDAPVQNLDPSITITQAQKNFPGPGGANPTDWTFTVSGTFSAPVVNGNNWQLTGMSLTVVPKDGGRSDSYGVQAGSNPSSWTVTTNTCGAGDYFLFVIATASLPNPQTTTALSSAPVFSNMPQNSPTGQMNNAFPAKGYVSFNWFVNPTRNANMISATSRTNAGANATTDLQSKPVIVVIPKNGGQYFRSNNGSWGNPPAQQEPYTGTASSPQLPAGTQYYTYMHMTGVRAGGTPPTNIGCTSVKGPM